MIRLVQRRLIVPRGDTGSFSIPMIANKNSGDKAIFTIFNPLTHRKILEKEVESSGDNLVITFTHGDTVNLPTGAYVWDIKFYVNPVIVDDKLVDGEEVDSYYAAFTLPACEIRETGDDMLMDDETPSAKLAPGEIDYITAAINEIQADKDIAASSATSASNDATAAANSAAAALLSEQHAATSETNAADSATAAAASALQAQQTAQAIHEEIPTHISDLIDDSGHYTKPATGIPASDLEETYLTQHQDISMKANSADLATVATSGAYSDLTGVPTNVSTFTNDAGYLTQHQDISGKANSADLATVATSGSYEDLSNKPTIPDVQINGSSIVDNGIANIPYATSLTAGAVKSSGFGVKVDEYGRLMTAKASSQEVQQGINQYKSIVPYNEHEATFYGLAKAAGDATQSQSSNSVGTYTDSAKTAIQNMLGVPAASAIPTLVSQLTNDSGYLTSFTETDPTVPAWAKAQNKPTYTASEVGAPTVAEMNTAIGTAIGNINSFDMLAVQELPSQDISTHTIYLVPKTGETNDVYDEYVYINNAWEMVGNTQIDLSNYVQKTDYATTSTAGIVKINTNLGINIITSGAASIKNALSIIKATTNDIKEGENQFNSIVPYSQHIAIFYGLAKAAGDATQSQSDNTVGTYTTEAKAAIRSMLDVPATSDIPSVPVQDVQVNGVSVLSQGVANMPLASGSAPGVVIVNGFYGHNTNSSGVIIHKPAASSTVKSGTETNDPIVPSNQHISAFYGLAKAAGADMKNSSNAVGTYTDAAKDAIQNMLGISDLLSTREVSTATAAHAINTLFLMDGKLYKATSAIAVGDAVVEGTNCEVVKVDEVFVKNTDYATSSIAGIVKVNSDLGIMLTNNNQLQLVGPTDAQIKAGIMFGRVITPLSQHKAVFYGLAKAAGDITQASSANTVGTYTTTAATAIKTMLQVQEGLEVVRLI